MSLTNFGLLTTEQLTIWQRDVWKAARNWMFLERFSGSSTTSMIQKVTELTKSEKGARAVLTLVADLEGDGVAGDRTLEGNEEAMKSYDQVIQIDQLRHANRHEGRMADQKSVVTFRENSKDVLAYWLADRMDQLAFLTLSGIAYSEGNDGANRVGSDLINLDYAADVTAPSTNRMVRWDGLNSVLIEPGGANATSDVLVTDTPAYNMLVDLKAYCVDNYIRPIIGEAGDEQYNVFMAPLTIAKLKKDTAFREAWKDALPRSPNNPLFKGTKVIHLDGMNIFEYRHVYTTKNATSGVDKWGAGSNIDGTRVLVCGAQAMGYADIGDPYWIEKGFDYDNQQGISVGKICGLLKPQFHSIYSGTTEDFGVLAVNIAL